MHQDGVPFNPRPHCWMTFGVSHEQARIAAREGARQREAHCFVSLCPPIAQSDVESHDFLFPGFPIALRAETRARSRRGILLNLNGTTSMRTCVNGMHFVR